MGPASRKAVDPIFLKPDDPRWPVRVSRRLGPTAPSALYAVGNLALLDCPLTALFCSTRCPGETIVRAYDQAAHWRDTGQAVIGGFHSPMEHECLRILLRGPQPVVVCPARGLPTRLAPELRSPLAAGRLLLLSPFAAAERRATRDHAARRNLLVAALAQEVWFAHIAPAGQMAELARRVSTWSELPRTETESSHRGSKPQVSAGAKSTAVAEALSQKWIPAAGLVEADLPAIALATAGPGSATRLQGDRSRSCTHPNRRSHQTCD